MGASDERDLFPEAIRLIDECRSRCYARNVRGLLDAVFLDYRNKVEKQLKKLGYKPGWRLLNTSDYGVSQLRSRVVFVAIHSDIVSEFELPTPNQTIPANVGELLVDLMKEKGWRGAKKWKKHKHANAIAPTLVGGSKKHGGPDLGLTRAKCAWATLGIDGRGLWDDPPDKDFIGIPHLTPRMTARIQDFPDEWQFVGRKTAMYRQIGNAFPPPVAAAVAKNIIQTLSTKKIYKIA